MVSWGIVPSGHSQAVLCVPEKQNQQGFVQSSIDGTGQSSSDGVPSARKMVFSWSISLSPGRYGVRSMSSANIVPTDQMSTAEL
jgi:hypothetical protein